MVRVRDLASVFGMICGGVLLGGDTEEVEAEVLRSAVFRVWAPFSRMRVLGGAGGGGAGRGLDGAMVKAGDWGD